MKRIGLLSDTHAYWDDKYAKYFAECDEIWHAGDIGSLDLADKLEELGKTFRAVCGNIDDQKMRLRYPKEMQFNVEGVDVYMTHIGGYPGKYAPGILTKISTIRPKIFVCGHSHILRVKYDQKLAVLCVNPGAAGQYGMQAVRTLIRFSIDGENITDMEVIELTDQATKPEKN